MSFFATTLVSFVSLFSVLFVCCLDTPADVINGMEKYFAYFKEVACLSSDIIVG